MSTIEEIESEITSLKSSISEFDVLLKKPFDTWPLEDRNMWGAPKNLRLERTQLRGRMLQLQEKENILLKSKILAEDIISHIKNLINPEEVHSILTSTGNLYDAHEEDSLFKIKIPCIHGKRSFLFSKHVYSCHESLHLSKPVKDVYALLQSQHVVLVGVSGCGKTRTCMDLSQYIYTIYVDCDQDRDFLNIITLMEKNIPNSLNDQHEQYNFEDYCLNLLYQFFLIRLVALEKLKEWGKVKNSFDWLCYQCSRRTRTLFDLIQKKLPEFSLTELQKAVILLCSKLSVSFIFDECQVLLKGKLQESFRSLNSDLSLINGRLENPRSLYTFLARSVIRDIGVKSLWSGTHLRLKSIELFKSAAGGKQDLYTVYWNFNYLTPTHIISLLHLYLNLENQVSEQDLNIIANGLQGRPRFFSRYMEKVVEFQQHLDNPSSRIMICFNEYFASLTEPYYDYSKHSSLYMFWENNISATIKPFKSPSNQKYRLVMDELVQLASRYLFCKGNERYPEEYQVLESQQDLIATALVMVVNIGELGCKFFMAEPAVVIAGMNYLKSLDAEPLIDCLANNLFQATISPQEKGKQMELIFVIRCLQGWWRSIPEFADIPVPVGVRDFRTGKNVNRLFIEGIKDQNYIFLPPEKAGPDVIYRHLFAYFKTTWTSKRISNSTSQLNEFNMNYQNWYSSDSNLASQIQAVLEEIYLPENMIHIRIEFPLLSKRLNNSQVSEGFLGSKIYNIDLEHPMARIIFTDELIKKLKSYHNIAE